MPSSPESIFHYFLAVAFWQFASVGISKKRSVENGIEELENPHVFEISEIKKAGGVKSLAHLMNATQAILEVKRRLLVA